MMTEQQFYDLSMRIVDGAAYIEKLDKKDPKYLPAMAKYDGLCEEYIKNRREEIARDLSYMRKLYEELGLI